VSVVVPAGQGCCGALHLHGGDPEEARRLVRRNLDAFPADVDAVVVNAAGCGSAMKEWGELLDGDPRYRDRARSLAARVRDVSEFLAALPIEPPAGKLRLRVAYHDACHLVHGQRIAAEPRALLRAIPGVDLVDLPESDVCCGSAGSYNLTEPAMARRLQERKVRNITATAADCVATGNPGCALQIRAGLERSGASVRVAHPVELLDEAYNRAGG
jgi:glycolate oxidase iron-sulfur subunit